MNALQEAKLTMYRAVQTHCDANGAITSTNLAFTTAYADFVTQISKLQGSETVVSKQTKGVAKDKQSLRLKLCRTTTDLAALVFAYASKTKNQVLQQQVNYSYSDLEKIKDEMIAPACQNILEAANANLAALADYGVTNPMLTALQTDIDNYTNASQSPQAAKATKQTENAKMKDTIKLADDVLKNQMDKLVVNFKAANPDFVDTYFNVRVIIDPTGGSKPKPPKP